MIIRLQLFFSHLLKIEPTAKYKSRSLTLLAPFIPNPMGDSICSHHWKKKHALLFWFLHILASVCNWLHPFGSQVCCPIVCNYVWRSRQHPGDCLVFSVFCLLYRILVIHINYQLGCDWNALQNPTQTNEMIRRIGYFNSSQKEPESGICYLILKPSTRTQFKRKKKNRNTIQKSRGMRTRISLWNSSKKRRKKTFNSVLFCSMQ